MKAADKAVLMMLVGVVAFVATTLIKHNQVKYDENACWMVVFEDGSAKFSWGHRPMMHVQVPQTKDYPGLNIISGGDVDGNIIDMTGPGGIPKVIRVPALDLRDKPDKYGNTITR